MKVPKENLSASYEGTWSKFTLRIINHFSCGRPELLVRISAQKKRHSKRRNVNFLNILNLEVADQGDFRGQKLQTFRYF